MAVYGYCAIHNEIFEKDGKEHYLGTEKGFICGKCREKYEEEKRKKVVDKQTNE